LSVIPAKAQLFSTEKIENQSIALRFLLENLEPPSQNQSIIIYSKDLNVSSLKKKLKDQMNLESYFNLDNTRSSRNIKDGDLLIIDADLNEEISQLKNQFPNSLFISRNYEGENLGINYVQGEQNKFLYELNLKRVKGLGWKVKEKLLNSDLRIQNPEKWESIIGEQGKLIQSQNKNISEFKDSLAYQKDSIRRANEIINMQENYLRMQEDSIATSKKLIQSKKQLLSEKESTISYLRLILIISIIALAMIVSLLIFLKNENKEKKRVLSELKKSNQEILDSINYAHNIQKAILPKIVDFKKIWPESFVLFKPKDIVSGDFYWTRDFEYVKLLCVADCTGHGVPGALMSMIGHEILDNVSSLPETIDTSKTLDFVDKRIMEQINKDGSQLDGMDASLIAYYPDKRLIQFSGANNALYQFRGGKINRIPASRYGLGGGFETTKKEFICTEIHVEKGDYYFLTTDGIQDQFGGDVKNYPMGKKLGRKRLVEFLELSSFHDFNNFDMELSTFINDWKGDFEQIDDICMIGIKIV
jgi:serine phosphatase RsbU (regulator of sigma subunit)